MFPDPKAVGGDEDNFFKAFDEDLECAASYKGSWKNFCMLDNTDCSGPHCWVSKELLFCENDLIVFEFPSANCQLSILDFPLERMFGGKPAKLFAAHMLNHNHFVSWIKFDKCWSFYDSLQNPMMKNYDVNNENKIIRKMLLLMTNWFRFCSLVYEFDNKNNNNTTGNVTIDMSEFETDSEAENIEELLDPELAMAIRESKQKARKRAAKEAKESSEEEAKECNMEKEEPLLQTSVKMRNRNSDNICAELKDLSSPSLMKKRKRRRKTAPKKRQMTIDEIIKKMKKDVNV